MNARSAVPYLVIAAVTLLTGAAHAGAWIPAPGEKYTELRTSLFSCDSYYSPEGFRAPLTGGGLYEHRALLWYSEFGWKKHISFLMGLPAVSVTRRTGDSRFDRTESGFGDLQAGFRFNAANGPTALSLQLEWNGQTGYRRKLSPQDSLGRKLAVDDRPASDRVADVAELPALLGNGQQDVTALVQFGTRLASRGFLELAGGYRYRFSYEEYANQILAGADLGFWFGPSLLLGGRYRGAIASGDGLTPADRITEHLSGPLLVYRVDDHMDLVAGSFHTAKGKNALHIDQVYVALALKKTRLNRLQGFLGNTSRP